MNIKNFVNYLGRNSRIVLAVAMFVGVFLFWFVRYPYALSYQEQNQLFLFTDDYLVSDVSKMGGLAAYLGEFIVQFYYVECLGAAMLALVYVLLYVLLSRVMKPSLALVPCVLMLWHYGDENVLLPALFRRCSGLPDRWLGFTSCFGQSGRNCTSDWHLRLIRQSWRRCLPMSFCCNIPFSRLSSELAIMLCR